MSDKYIRLKDGQDYVYPEMYGIDVNNILFSSSTATSYTAIEDCWVYSKCDNSKYINNIEVADTSNSTKIGALVFLKKGQTFSHDNNIEKLIVYGLKYHS